MADFTRDNKGLVLAFPPSSISLHQPGSLGETVSLVHPFLGPLLRTEELLVTNFAPAVGVASVDFPAGGVPQRFVEWILGSDIQHTDPVARNMNWAILNVAVGGTPGLVDATGAAIAASTPVTLRRPAIIPAGFVLRMQVPGLAAAQFMLSNVISLRLNIAEVPPAL